MPASTSTSAPALAPAAASSVFVFVPVQSMQEIRGSGPSLSRLLSELGYVWSLCSPLSAALLFWTVALHGFVAGQGRGFGIGVQRKGFDWLLDWAGLGSNFPVTEIATRIFCPHIASAFFCPRARIAVADI